MFVIAPLHFFGSTSTISRFGERFCDGQYTLVSFLFAVLLLTVPPCRMESAPLMANALIWSPELVMAEQYVVIVPDSQQQLGLYCNMSLRKQRSLANMHRQQTL